MTTSRTRLPGNRSRTSTQAMTVPITMLTSGHQQRLDDGQLDGRQRLRVGERVPEAAPAALGRPVATTAASGISTSRLNHIIATPSPSPDARCQSEPVAAAGRRVRAGRPRHGGEPSSTRGH